MPPSYRLELVSKALTFPSGAAFDDEGILHVIEAGYSYGLELEDSRLLLVNQDKSMTKIYKSERNGPINGVRFHDGNFIIVEGGQKKGAYTACIRRRKNGADCRRGLPPFKNHQTIGPDGSIYFA